MKAWQLFWTAALLLAGGSFAFITVVVIVRGLRDLRQMFTALRAQQDRPSKPNPSPSELSDL